MSNTRNYDTQNNSFHFDSDGDNTAQAMKTSGGYLLHLHVINTNTADAYLQIFDAAVGDVTVGTTTPTQSYLIPAAASSTKAGAFVLDITEGGWPFSTAITYACTTTASGSGDPTTGLIVNAVYRS